MKNVTYKPGDKLRVLFDCNGLKKGEIVIIKSISQTYCKVSHNEESDDPGIALTDRRYNTIQCWHYGSDFLFEKIPNEITDWSAEFND